MAERTFPTALPAPTGAMVSLDQDLARQALETSRQSPRGRVILPLQDGPDNPLHRMFNAIQPGSFVRPHRHLDPPKDEALVVLSGALGVLLFDDDGRVTGTALLRADGPRFGIDLKAGAIHSILALEPDTLLFEVKPGPYSAATDKEFVPWAPAEGTPEAAALLVQWRERVLADDQRRPPRESDPQR